MSSAEIENSSQSTGSDSTSSGAGEHSAGLDYEPASGKEDLAEALYRDASTGAAAAASDASATAESAASAFADSGHEKLSQAANALSEQIRKVSSYFENRGIDDVIGDARRLVERNPALFIAGGVAVGFALSRLLTSAEQSRSGRRH
jgi:hypothetical protein